ncbi:TonB-linked outer membrane protein, SusC/RagA family [Chitinophaga jiangningensis]|uniref:TonB-linked outer membrane protein, SusC/RagA family n=1 Tax=Chitinophaga jiangningensis TaxID=1419482 RepID=A0A1M6Z308_9BACT|nr:SusC/RagA family TonB-linked outer membrane protein [Chitinophaga jiangningensis]SHL24772.1 TonB-linked outer membrane protein, SusC/RagA family [Chitinophaga jiangningensis]
MNYLYKAAGVCMAVMATAGISTAATLPQDTAATKKITPAKDSAWFAQPVYLWNKTLSRANMTGAASSIYHQDVQSTPVADISNVLTGRLAGLLNTQYGGAPGKDAATMIFRGKMPLIVIDGVVRDFTAFNPNDIESVTLLKDAVANAMYGQRSSNGVLMITTRSRGRKDFEVSATAQYGVLEQLYRPTFLGAYDYASLYNEAQLNTAPGTTPRFTQSMLDAWKNHTNDPYTQPDVDWQDAVTKSTGNQQRYNINMGGKAKSYHYFASLEHFGQSGMFTTSPLNSYNTNNDYKRYNIRTNAAVAFNKDIELTLNVFGSLATGYEPGEQTNETLSKIANTAPIAFPIYNKNGSFAGTNIYRDNPMAMAVNSGYLMNTQRRISADMGLQYKLDDFVKGMWVKAQLSMNNFYSEVIDRSKTYAVFEPDTSTGALPNSYIQYNTEGIVKAGRASVATQTRQNYYNIMVGYSHNWNEHTLDVLGTYNQDNNIASFYQLNTVYSNFGVNANYNWKNTYLAELALIYGSLNRYQPGSRGAFLPALGLGWVISNESFFSSHLIDRLKIRASIGKNAYGDPDNYYPYLSNYKIDTTGYNVGESASAVSGATKSQVANPGYTWEKSLKLEVGIEAALLHNQLSVTLDYYRNKFYDLLQTRGKNSGIFGQPYPLENIGTNRYSGIEAVVNYSPEARQGFKYYVEGNISAAYSKVINTGDQLYPYPWLYRTGQPDYQLFALVADGFYQTSTDISKTANYQGYTPAPGDIKYKDLNNDGVINELDKKGIVTTKPTIFYGVTGGINYKGFDFKLLIQGVANRQIIMSPSSMMPFYTTAYANAQEMHFNRWTPANNVNAEFPRLTLGSNVNNSQLSTFWLKNGSYLRLKNIELGYDFKNIAFQQSKLSQLRVFVNAYNLFTSSHLGDLDPESTYTPLSNQRIINGGITIGL